MDRREAIREFIRRASKWFSISPFPYDLYRQEKKQFFESQARVAPPKDREIAETALSMMIENHQLATREDLELKLAWPFFKDNVQNKDLFYQKLEFSFKKLEPTIDIEALEKEESKKEILDQLKKQATEEVLKEKSEEIQQLDEEIRQMREKHHSVLDSFTDSELDEEEGQDTQKRDARPLWEEKGLTEDPFPPDTVGISRFEKSDFDLIVHKTPLFDQYVDWVETQPSKLFGNRLVYGLYGSGKSTFLEYLEPKLGLAGIVSIYITVSTAHDIETVNYDFLRQLYNKLLEKARERSAVPPDINPNDKMESIERMIKTLALDHGIKGFIIFLEDLHKGDSGVAVQLLSDLQGITRELKRNTGVNNISFYVESDIELYRRVLNNPKYTGSIERVEPMPPVEVDWALDAINKRLRFFSKNRENPVRIDRKFVEKVYYKIKTERGPEFLTIRTVMREVAEAFERGDPELRISARVLIEIKSLYDSNPNVGRSFRQLISRTRLKPKLRDNCLRLLVKVYMDKGISESKLENDPTMKRRMWYLEVVDLVRRSGDEETIFTPSNPLLRLNHEIRQKYSLTLDYYLLQIYGTEKETRPRPRNVEIEFIEALIPQSPILISKLLADAKSYHASLIELQRSDLSTNDFMRVLNLSCASIAELTRAYQAFEGLPPTKELDQKTIEFWKDFWFSPEVVTKFLSAVKEAEQEPSEERIRAVLACYLDLFTELVHFFKREYEGKSRLTIPINNLTNEEIKTFHECRDLLADPMYFSRYNVIVEKATRLVERKLRAFLYNAFSLLYGGRESRMKWLDPNVRGNIQKRLSKSEFQGINPQNEFEQVNRTEYRAIVTGKLSEEGRRSWDSIFAVVFSGWGEDRLNQFFQVGFEPLDLIAAHQKPMVDNQEGQVFAFLREAIDFVFRINIAYSRFVAPDSYKFVSGSDALFSFCDFKDEQTLSSIKIDSQKAMKSFERLSIKGVIELDLEDQSDIEGRLLMDYRSSCACLAMTRRPDNALNYRLNVFDKMYPRLICSISPETNVRKQV